MGHIKLMGHNKLGPTNFGSHQYIPSFFVIIDFETTLANLDSFLSVYQWYCWVHTYVMITIIKDEMRMVATSDERLLTRMEITRSPLATMFCMSNVCLVRVYEKLCENI